MVGIYGGGGCAVLGLSFRSWAIHFCLCAVVFTCVRLSLLMSGCLHSCTVVFAHVRWAWCWDLHGVGVCMGVGVHIGVVGGQSLLSVDGASLWWVGHCGGWGVVVHGVVSGVPLLCGRGFMVLLRKPSSTWNTQMGVPRQPLGGGHCCHPLSFLGSWAFVMESVIVDMVHPDGCAMSAVCGVVVSVCIVGFIDDVDEVGMGLTWHRSGHDGGVGWW